MKKIYTKEDIKKSIDRLNNVLPDKDVCNGQLFKNFMMQIYQMTFHARA